LKREDCPSFDTCGAPLCPLDLESLKNGIFYPDEEICKRRNAPAWIKVQRKIAKKTGDKDKYFTYEMLAQNCVISKGITGLDPDKEQAPQLKRWLEHHPVKRERTEEERIVLRERFLENILKAKQEEFELTASKK